MDPTEILAYYSHVLEYAFALERGQMRAKCIHHSDSKRSLVIDPDDGSWTCRCGSGSIHDYEMKRRGEEGRYEYEWTEAENRIQQIVLDDKAKATAG